MATIKDQLLTLDEPYRSQALANTTTYAKTRQAYTLSSAIEIAFIWGATKEGHSYWKILYDFYYNRQLTEVSSCCNNESEPRGADLEAIAVCAGCGRPFVPRYETMEEFKERLNIE